MLVEWVDCIDEWGEVEREREEVETRFDVRELCSFDVNVLEWEEERVLRLEVLGRCVEVYGDLGALETLLKVDEGSLVDLEVRAEVCVAGLEVS